MKKFISILLINVLLLQSVLPAVSLVRPVWAEQGCPPGQQPCEENYFESCGINKQRLCHKKGCSVGGVTGSSCSWGPASFCEECKSISEALPSPTTTPTPGGQPPTEEQSALTTANLGAKAIGANTAMMKEILKKLPSAGWKTASVMVAKVVKKQKNHQESVKN